MDYADKIEYDAKTAFINYVADMDSFHKVDTLTQDLVRSFFIGGYLKGVQSTFPTINKENTSERIESRTVAE